MFYTIFYIWAPLWICILLTWTPDSRRSHVCRVYQHLDSLASSSALCMIFKHCKFNSLNVYWNIYFFISAAINCPLPVINVYSNVTGQTGNKFGDSIFYQCDPGYILISGNLTRKCLIDGKWDGSPPLCSGRYRVTFDINLL